MTPEEQRQAVLQQANPSAVGGWVGTVVSSVRYVSLADAGIDSKPVTIPVGTNKLTWIRFNPNEDRLISIGLRVQSSRLNILEDFQTDIGEIGLLPLDETLQSRDELIVTVTNISGGVLTNIGISFGFRHSGTAQQNPALAMLV